MSDLLGIGASAVSAYRLALSAIGENVANSETPGYARRQIHLREASATGSGSPIYSEALLFGGVKAGSVVRAWDTFRAADSRFAASAAGRAQVRQQWLSGIETALDDGPAGVGPLMAKFFNAGVSLAANPDDTLGRRSMLMALEDTAGAMRNTAESLARVAEGVATAATIEVDALNSDLAALAEVNTALRQSGPGTPTRASLEDERDRLLDGIADRTDITVAIGADGGATVTMSQAADAVLVDRTGAALVSLHHADDGRISLRLHDGGTIVPLPASGGRLSGLADVAATTADRRAALDSLAADFTAAINNWSAQGRDPAGNPGGTLLAGAGAASMRVLTSDPAAIAAAAPAGAANGNLLALSALRDTNGSEGQWSTLVAGHSLILASANSEAAAASNRRDNSFAARDEITGVDLDHEAAELMRFQQAYSGATKIIQVARETLQSIIDLF